MVEEGCGSLKTVSKDGCYRPGKVSHFSKVLFSAGIVMRIDEYNNPFDEMSCSFFTVMRATGKGHRA